MILAAALAIVSGCAKDNRTGVVIEGRSRRAWLLSGGVSRVTIRRSDETTARIAHVGNPFYMIAFIEVPAGAPGFIDPRVEKLARKFEVDSIVVIQISLAAKDSTFSDEQIAEGDRKIPDLLNLSRFYDPRRLAWEGYGRPENGTLLLVDCRGMGSLIRMKRTLDTPDDIVRRVKAMQFEWENNAGDFSYDDD